MVTVAAIDKRVHSGSISSVKLNYAVDKTFNVDDKTSLVLLLKNIKKYLGVRKIKRLTLLCHGRTLKEKSSGNLYYALELCNEYVHIKSAHAFGLLSGCFASRRTLGIDIIACGSQDGSTTSPSATNRALISQGINMAQSIADGAGTVVRASPDTQLVKYAVQQSRSNPAVLQKNVTVTPGQWEGRVWYFFPKKTKPFRKTGTGFKPVRR